MCFFIFNGDKNGVVSGPEDAMARVLPCFSLCMIDNRGRNSAFGAHI
ncbi:hypothetical protein HMPREF9534_02793 [Escherichia coli MS 69-1]|nr:hypothetical protein HMPREF9534_02793 [Escherichia coli MS 69-1]